MVYSLFELLGQGVRAKFNTILAHSASSRIIYIKIPQKLRTKSSLNFIVYTFGRDLTMLLSIQFSEYLYVFVRKFIFQFFAGIIFFNYLDKLVVLDFGVNLLFEFLQSLGISLLFVHKIIDHGIY